MSDAHRPDGGQQSAPSAPSAQVPRINGYAAPTMLHILQHALGRDQYGRNPHGGPDYRNHYVAGGEDVATCREAVAVGLMVEHPPSQITGGDPLFTVTDAGKAHVLANSLPPPKLTRGQERYRRWLDVSDATGETFRDFLKRGAK